MPTRLRRQQLKRLHPDQRLADKVLEILIWCGLIDTGYSINGGINYYFPKVEEVVDGPPKGLIIRMRPCQTPADFDAKATMIAHHLDIARVTVIQLRPPHLIRLELQPHPGSPRPFWE